jgi:RNA polymerase sigma-70 factor (ECF subfamily)
MGRDVGRVFEEYLVLQAQAGDREALARLAARWRPRHYAHARRLLRNPEDAADAVQEAWISIVRGLRNVRHSELFAAWSFSVVTRRCQDHMRRASREPPTEPDADVAADAADPMTGRDLSKALARLPPDQRAAVALFYLEDFSVAEVAASLCVPVGTVKSRLHHARLALRRFFDQPDIEKGDPT